MVCPQENSRRSVALAGYLSILPSVRIGPPRSSAGALAAGTGGCGRSPRRHETCCLPAFPTTCGRPVGPAWTGCSSASVAAAAARRKKPARRYARLAAAGSRQLAEEERSQPGRVSVHAPPCRGGTNARTTASMGASTSASGSDSHPVDDHAFAHCGDGSGRRSGIHVLRAAPWWFRRRTGSTRGRPAGGGGHPRCVCLRGRGHTGQWSGSGMLWWRFRRRGPAERRTRQRQPAGLAGGRQPGPVPPATRPPRSGARRACGNSSMSSPSEPRPPHQP